MNAPTWIKTSVAASTIVALAAISIYYFKFGVSNKLGDQATFGQFGDYVGGLLNPLLSFTSILILLWSVRISNTALLQSQILHQEQVENQRRESIRIQLKEDAEVYVTSCEQLMDKPLFHIPAFYADGATLSLNDTFKNPEFFGVPLVEELINDLASRTADTDAVGLHLNTLRTQLAFAVSSACNLIQYLDVPSLRQSWDMRLQTLIVDINSMKIISDSEANDFKLALLGAMSIKETSTPTKKQQHFT